MSEVFEFYIDDDRYAVPTLKLFEAADERTAAELAGRMLKESRHHRGVELCREGQRLLGLGSFTQPRRPAPRPDA